ncbi:mCG146991 [Mus musculus]|nr:mCG146991 [Mus musculus]
MRRQRSFPAMATWLSTLREISWRNWAEVLSLGLCAADLRRPVICAVDLHLCPCCPVKQGMGQLYCRMGSVLSFLCCHWNPMGVIQHQKGARKPGPTLELA